MYYIIKYHPIICKQLIKMYLYYYYYALYEIVTILNISISIDNAFK